MLSTFLERSRDPQRKRKRQRQRKATTLSSPNFFFTFITTFFLVLNIHRWVVRGRKPSLRHSRRVSDTLLPHVLAAYRDSILLHEFSKTLFQQTLPISQHLIYHVINLEYKHLPPDSIGPSAQALKSQESSFAISSVHQDIFSSPFANNQIRAAVMNPVAAAADTPLYSPSPIYSQCAAGPENKENNTSLSNVSFGR